MFFRPRTESDKIKILRILNTRMDLPENDKQHYFNLKKGFEEGIESLVMRSAGDLKLLFPDKKITTNVCSRLVSSRCG